MLRSVVSEEEEPKKANIKGWDIAGKTGTAKKVTNGKYSNDKYVEFCWISTSQKCNY